MSYSHSKIEIKTSPEFGLNCIHFVFKDKFTQDASDGATKYWSGLFDENPSSSYSFIWDCSQMSGFEPSARTIWYAAMKKHKNRIEHVTIISPSILIRGAARVMMEVFGVKSKMLRSIDDLKEMV